MRGQESGFPAVLLFEIPVRAPEQKTNGASIYLKVSQSKTFAYLRMARYYKLALGNTVEDYYLALSLSSVC